MKTLLLLGSSLLLTHAFSQTSLFLEDFETGGGTFSINTSDMSSATNSSQNDWIINNIYAGGSGTLVCLGFPFSFSVPATPSQPGGIANGPNSTYLHIAADAAVSSGINCASYVPADGTCNLAENHFVKMTSPVSTTGMNNVTVDFWWLCGGSPEAFGEVYYSLDNGVTWVLQQTSMQGQTSWTNAVITNPTWSNQASIQFGIRFVNATSGTGADPAFSMDDFEIFATAISANTITTTDDVTPSSWCFDAQPTGTVNFTASGTFNAGNVYSAELSDASGSFAAPIVIGTLNSTSTGSLSIATNLPTGVVAGNGYRIRVVSSNPATTGSDNTSNLIVNALPTVTISALADVCVYNASFSLSQGSPAGGNYSGTGVSGGMFTPNSAGIGAHTITYTYADGNGCSNSANTVINVNGCAGLNDLEENSLVVYPNPVQNYFQMKGIENWTKMEILDIAGKTVHTYINEQEIYNISMLPNGIYNLRIHSEGKPIHIKLVKE